MATITNSNVSIGYAVENVYGQPSYKRYLVKGGLTLTLHGNVVHLNGIYDFTQFSSYKIGQSVWIVGSDGKEYEFKFKDITDNVIRLDPSPGMDLTGALATTIKEWYILPEFTQICFKAGGIQRGLELVEDLCMSEDGQGRNKKVTGYTLTTTLETNYTGSDFSKYAVASVLHGKLRLGEDIILSAASGSKVLDTIDNMYTYTITGVTGLELGLPFMITGTNQKSVKSGIFYINGVAGNQVTFKTPRNFEITTDIVNWTMHVFDTIKNGTNVSSFNIAIANETLNYYKGLTGAVFNSLDLSSPSNELVTMNFGAVCGGDFYISPTTTNLDDIGVPPYSKLNKDLSTGLPFIGSKSFLYLNGRAFPVSEFTLKTGETFMVEKSGRSSEEFNDALYPNKVSMNNFSQIGGTFKCFLDKNTLRLIMASANSCVANLFVVLQSVKGCESSNDKTQYLTIHVPSVTLSANDDNPALNTPTAVNVEYSAGKSELGYTLMMGMMAI